MSGEIIKFRPRNPALSNPVGEATTTNTANVVAIMNHGWVIDPNRIPKNDTSISIADIRDFQPESIPMYRAILESDDTCIGYEYQVFARDNTLWIPAKNFDMLKNPSIPLLFLMIHASRELERYRVNPDDIIKISKINLGGGNDEIGVSYQELDRQIDTAIERIYPNVYNTLGIPKRRRDFIHKRYIMPLLDPLQLGGQREETEGEN